MINDAPVRPSKTVAQAEASGDLDQLMLNLHTSNSYRKSTKIHEAILRVMEKKLAKAKSFQDCRAIWYYHHLVCHEVDLKNRILRKAFSFVNSYGECQRIITDSIYIHNSHLREMVPWAMLRGAEILKSDPRYKDLYKDPIGPQPAVS